MANCAVCGEALPADSTTCALCGTTSDPELPVAKVETLPPRQSVLARPLALPPGSRYCPACGTTYAPDYADSFCTCGMELLTAPTPTPDPVPAVAAATIAAATIAAATRPKPDRPPPGTHCLVLYGADRQPIQYFPLDKDALLIGRLDAVQGIFPDIDVTECLEAASARKVSRRHALVLRLRATGALVLRPLAGNTGTQLDADMVMPLADYPLEPGRRIILGGVVRFKYEVS